MMQMLYPIIRRKRRRLVVADAPPVVVGNVEPVQPVAAQSKVEAVVPIEPAKTSDEKVPGKKKTR